MLISFQAIRWCCCKIYNVYCVSLAFDKQSFSHQLTPWSWIIWSYDAHHLHEYQLHHHNLNLKVPKAVENDQSELVHIGRWCCLESDHWCLGQEGRHNPGAVDCCLTIFRAFSHVWWVEGLHFQFHATQVHRRSNTGFGIWDLPPKSSTKAKFGTLGLNWDFFRTILIPFWDF